MKNDKNKKDKNKHSKKISSKSIEEDLELLQNTWSRFDGTNMAFNSILEKVGNNPTPSQQTMLDRMGEQWGNDYTKWNEIVHTLQQKDNFNQIIEKMFNSFNDDINHLLEEYDLEEMNEEGKIDAMNNTSTRFYFSLLDTLSNKISCLVDDNQKDQKNKDQKNKQVKIVETQLFAIPVFGERFNTLSLPENQDFLDLIKNTGMAPKSANICMLGAVPFSDAVLNIGQNYKSLSDAVSIAHHSLSKEINDDENFISSIEKIKELLLINDGSKPNAESEGLPLIEYAKIQEKKGFGHFSPYLIIGIYTNIHDLDKEQTDCAIKTLNLDALEKWDKAMGGFFEKYTSLKNEVTISYPEDIHSAISQTLAGNIIMGINISSHTQDQVEGFEDKLEDNLVDRVFCHIGQNKDVEIMGIDEDGQILGSAFIEKDIINKMFYYIIQEWLEIEEISCMVLDDNKWNDLIQGVEDYIDTNEYHYHQEDTVDDIDEDLFSSYTSKPKRTLH